MKSKLLKKLRWDAKNSIVLYRNRLKSNYEIVELFTRNDYIVEFEIIKTVENKEEAYRQLIEERRKFILKKLGNKRILK